MAEDMNGMLLALGRKIKASREKNKITLKDLAAKTGVTPSLLSQIENGKAAPSLTTLKSIADVFSIPIGFLFDSAIKHASSPVVKKNSHKRIIIDGNIRHSLLSQGLGDFEALLIEFPAGSSTGREPYSHEGTECAYVIKGSLVISLEGRDYFLDEGDSITFESHKPHVVKNISEESASVVWVDSKRWFFSHE